MYPYTCQLAPVHAHRVGGRRPKRVSHIPSQLLAIQANKIRCAQRRASQYPAGAQWGHIRLQIESQLLLDHDQVAGLKAGILQLKRFAV